MIKKILLMSFVALLAVPAFAKTKHKKPARRHSQRGPASTKKHTKKSHHSKSSQAGGGGSASSGQ